MTENDLQVAVLDLAKLLHLRVHHDRPARTVQGWRTPVQGHAGFPDLLLVGPGGVLYRELKRESGRPSPDQRAWLDALAAAGCDTGLWRPSDLRSGRIEREMKGIARSA